MDDLSNECYLIWSVIHAMWWKPNEHGYTDNLDEAGLYTNTESNRVLDNANICGVVHEVRIPSRCLERRRIGKWNKRYLFVLRMRMEEAGHDSRKVPFDYQVVAQTFGQAKHAARKAIPGAEYVKTIFVGDEDAKITAQA